ncbi:MAG: two pore domain potassium channel family protein [Nitrospirae bacterium]|nr:MAG: two pore domain potassium channel family protein [Nitrospirota bacterium]
MLIDSLEPRWKPASLGRSFVSALINLCEIVIAFAAIYLSIGCIVLSSGLSISSCTSKCVSDIEQPVEALYYSMVTTATLGYGDFVPGNWVSRGIVFFHLLIEVLFLVAIVPVILSNFVNRLGGREYRNLDTKE